MLTSKHGFTLIEVMIALVVNLILFAGLIAVFGKNIEHYQQSINTNRLNEQLSSTMQILSSDIRRAGYWADAATDIGRKQNSNPFMTNATKVQVYNAGQCLLLSYDRNSDGKLPAISNLDDDERYGFRLMNGVIQARPSGSPFDCSAASTAWENVTDPTVMTVTNLTFTLTTTNRTVGSGPQGIQLRSVDITLTAKLTHDASVTKTLTQHVRIRNDVFIP